MMKIGARLPHHEGPLISEALRERFGERFITDAKRQLYRVISDPNDPWTLPNTVVLSLRWLRDSGDAQ